MSPERQACGFLILDKPAGLTSHQCVSHVRRAYGLRRVGHGGTLDPAVTGVLPIALGAATRLLPYLPGDKSYQGSLQLGLQTSTDDLQGEVLANQPVPALDASDLRVILERFEGSILQRPPQVSAVHVDGQRAYQRVRNGEQLDLAPRPVTIRRLQMLGWDPQQARLQLAVECSAGTYIRSLARDIGQLLGCGGCLAELRRTAALGFDLAAAVPFASLESRPPPPLLAPLAAVSHLPRLSLRAEEVAGWRCGRSLAADAAELPPLEPDAPVAILMPTGDLAGIARYGSDQRLQPRLVFEASD